MPVLRQATGNNGQKHPAIRPLLSMWSDLDGRRNVEYARWPTQGNRHFGWSVNRSDSDPKRIMTTRKPPTPPVPRQSRPLAQPKGKDRALTRKMMTAISSLIDQSEGKLTRQGLSIDIGRSNNEVVEWLGAWRNFPNAETTLALLRWAIQQDRSFVKTLFS